MTSEICSQYKYDPIAAKVEGAKKQWKRLKKENKLLGIGQIGEGFVEKLGYAYKETTYHLRR